MPYEDAVGRWLAKSIIDRIESVPTESVLFQTAIAKFPEAEIQEDMKVLRTSNVPLHVVASDAYEFKVQRVLNRWRNPICGACHRYGEPPGKLFPCESCGLTFYCNKRCAEDHARGGHSEWCQNVPDVDAVGGCPYRLKVFAAPPQAAIAARLAGRNGQREDGFIEVPGRSFAQAFTLTRS